MASQGGKRHACSLCARRKVKCDKGDPCSNCHKAQAQCLYEAPNSYRPRKRAADEDLIAQLARYENLMRKHNVDFTPFANTWVPSGLEVKTRAVGSPRPVAVSAGGHRIHSNCDQQERQTVNLDPCLWSILSPELKHPPIQNLQYKDDPSLHPTPPFSCVLSGTHPELYELHPSPQNIYRLWQTFVERVNPLIKIVHVPTLQQRILDASWDLPNVSKPLTAILFAIYTLAVTSISPDYSQSTLGEARDTLLIRYRVATLRALVAADFPTTKDFEVLQALVLFLLTDPESELTSTLSGVALRIGQRIGLHRNDTEVQVSFFEKEMRIRLWWQLFGLDSRVRVISSPGRRPSPWEFGDLRLPLNVNDADLHPDMIECPIEHRGPTEMLFVLMKFELSNWLRSSLTAAEIFQNIIHGPVKHHMWPELEDRAIDELQTIYQAKHFRYLDKRIPLHRSAYAMANLLIARLRFKVHHPRSRTAGDDGKIYLTQEESDTLFDSALLSLEMVDVGTHCNFASYLFTHMTSKPPIDAYIYVLSELRRRYSGDRVALAWRLVENLYDEHPKLISDGDNRFFVALGDLTLEAWEARRQGLVRDEVPQELNANPQFIQLLSDRRKEKAIEGASTPIISDFIMDADLDWEYWSDFLRL
ncbi:hypothetical protein P175DRAFT_0521416 [Aspergillus ochraceoroseus IBT 24754]|uniref:Zn(2)-C6 fungal-type domain-containing protein n=2 Tax=Aspergillus ochraceoroseus TaxID=138278 RepID=A0A2T5MAW2_9EURO|nr:uncharacterized protein P175DRAFT_0521416 [Aspergillus ochraceoroseus IBT 24754]KKK25407.1 hypothetical protein AOCH_006565 [Aspergillus ochraceoroseus]PTU25682.1 hypothetical protein P175DRAFT_0521416 [Aspergillus ochraceoroseus IBT 24754]